MFCIELKQMKFSQVALFVSFSSAIKQICIVENELKNKWKLHEEQLVVVVFAAV